jgi:hypothetical protein
MVPSRHPIPYRHISHPDCGVLGAKHAEAGMKFLDNMCAPIKLQQPRLRPGTLATACISFLLGHSAWFAIRCQEGVSCFASPEGGMSASFLDRK